MIDLTGVKHHPAISQIVEMLCNKIQTTDQGFFRVEVAYFLSKMASSMRATIVTKDRGEIPVNTYALALATSGFGKGHSVGLVENDLLIGFKRRFMEETFPLLAEQNLWSIANDRAVRAGTDPNEEFEKVEKEFRRSGALPFTFDSGTTPAVKQLRHKLLLSGCGSINMQIDEIGSNLVGSTEVLTAFLELYDQGMIKQKLTKNTADNQRGEEVDGKTPTNMLLFGTPSKLLDGGQTEDQFYDFLETGYARRCIFGFGQADKKAFHTLTAEEIYARLTRKTNTDTVIKWANHFHKLADPTMFQWKMEVPDEVAILNIHYKNECEKFAETLPEHDEIRKAEISHRYFKALKLAGALAFIDESTEVDLDHLKSAILLVEESGKSFEKILNREKAYVKLAKYISGFEGEVTHADLNEALPFYKSGKGARDEMMTMAVAWGYKNNILIKKTFSDGIEFFHGESLKETNINKLLISASNHFAYDYVMGQGTIDQLISIFTAEGMNWCNHAFKNGHRQMENILSGFNLIVLDVDGTMSLEAVKELLKDYNFITYTTKRHTEETNRFRLIMPMNYELELDRDDYKEFMSGIREWLPFSTDEASEQPEKKWLSNHNAEVYVNDGKLIDVLPFIPKTSKNEQHRSDMSQIENLDNLERWFAQRMASGNRNNNMLKFALALVDGGMDLMSVADKVKNFNLKLKEPLSENEIDNTVLVTVAKKYSRK